MKIEEFIKATEALHYKDGWTFRARHLKEMGYLEVTAHVWAIIPGDAGPVQAERTKRLAWFGEDNVILLGDQWAMILEYLVVDLETAIARETLKAALR